MYAPIVLFVYNRYEHTKKTLEALSKNTLASQSELYIFSDGARAEKDAFEVQRVRALVTEFSKAGVFKNVELHFAEKNRGLASSVIHGVTQVVERYGSVIVLEDDLLTTTDFLEYMNGALTFYRDDPQIWSISGFSFLDPKTMAYPHDVYMSYRGCSWGWATWQDRWNTVDWQVSDYRRFKFDPFMRKRFALGGSDMPDMLDMQMKGFVNSWAIRWCYQQSKGNKLTVYPKYSKIKNIGTDGSGTHSGNNRRNDVQLCEDQPCTFEHLQPDASLTERFRAHFHLPFLYRVKAYVKHVILSRK